MADLGEDSSEVTSSSKVERKDVYTSIPVSDHQWLKDIANRLGCTKSEAIRRLVYNARMRDVFDEEELI